MCQSNRLWRRLRSSSLKTKSHEKLQTIFITLICSIFFIVICSEFYFLKYSSHIRSLHRSYNPSIHSSAFIRAFRKQILVLEKKFGFHSGYNHYHDKSKQNEHQESLSEHEEYHKFLLESRKNSSNRFFFFNSSDTFHKLFSSWLETRTKSMPLSVTFSLNHRHVCANKGHHLSILIAVTSSATHLESRAAIRETWGGYAKTKGAKVIFFLGLPKNPKYHSRISEENEKFQDIIQGRFLDTYSNLTIKTISLLKWVSNVCSLVKYVLKVDDDMFINVENFFNITEGKNDSKVIMGELAHEWPPVRSPKNKWYTSFDDYPFNIYPDFVFGPSYLLTGDVVKILYEESIKMKLFHLEDVYITGMVAEKVKIKRINLPAMFNTPRDLQPCNFKRLLSSHGHTPPDMRRHWMWLTRRNFKCES